MTGNKETPGWLNDIQEALDRTGDAIRTAWDSTKDTRAAALESAKQAARELSQVIDEGIASAKERWAEGSAASEEE